MSWEPESNKETNRNPKDAGSRKERLPFEPKKNRQKLPKKPAVTSVEAKEKTNAQPVSPAHQAIPAAVSQRMLWRMGLFSGVPAVLGISTFIFSYIVVTNAWFKLPNTAVVLVSMGFFGLSVLGLSYGVISASWDEEKPGSALGWQEFTTNFGRMTEAWRSAKQKN